MGSNLRTLCVQPFLSDCFAQEAGAARWLADCNLWAADPWKGQHIALEALRSLPGVHLAIVGEALFTEEDRAYREELRRTAEEPGLQGRVHFLGFRSDVIELLHAMDVVVRCSVAAEPFGRVIVEAMLAGTPVVATRGGGVDEIITDGQDGFLVTAADPGALALAVGKIVQEPGLAEQLSSAALASASEDFRWIAPSAHP